MRSLPKFSEKINASKNCYSFGTAGVFQQYPYNYLSILEYYIYNRKLVALFCVVLPNLGGGGKAFFLPVVCQYKIWINKITPNLYLTISHDNQRT